MRLIVDTDAGIDDAEALIMALTYPNTTVEAITTVTGNVHVDQVNRNVCTILQEVGQSVPIYRGVDRPLIEKWQDEDEGWHLRDGLGNWDERPPCELHVEDDHAALALIRLVNQFPNELTLVALAPLTNIALAIRLDPTFPSKLKQFVVMGGAVDAHGNAPTITAEYNIFIDPEAAQIVFDAMPMTTVLSWEATLDNTLSMEQHHHLCGLQTTLARFYEGINQKVMERDFELNDGKKLLPDPLAMAITLNPDLILESELRHLTVELHGHLTRGQSVVNYTGYSTGMANVKIVRKIDMAGVFEIYEAMLR